VRRLFENTYAAEREYFERTKIFPIMHVIAIRRELYERDRWIAQSLYKGFVEAQRIAYRDLHETAALKTMLPWLIRHVAETEQLMGKDFWPYGYKPNVGGLEPFLRYHHEQGLSRRLIRTEELFAPETLESYII
jgi:4,5-dihydroxyphthalate decarboxylase